MKRQLHSNMAPFRFNTLVGRLLVVLACSLHQGAQAQGPVLFKIENDYGLIEQKHHKLEGAELLNPFFKKLTELQKTKTGQVNILHIGDSHIQADYITQQLRENFQLHFGNAGRGFVFPWRAAQSNEPAGITSKATGKWESKRVVFPDQPLPIGIGGTTLRTEEDASKISVSIKSNGINYSFNKVAAFFLNEPRSYHLAVEDSAGNKLAFLGSFTDSPWASVATVKLPYQARNATFSMVKSVEQQNRFTLFGLNFTNGNPGVLYHMVGANGAKFKHYTLAEHFAAQTQALQPDLVVISLGTNEAIEHPYSDPAFKNYIATLIDQIRKHNPQAVFLLTTPPDSFKKNGKRNPGVKEVSEKIIETANENLAATYHFFEASGGNHSASKWKKAGLLREDGIHFTMAGYELQGRMMFQVIINAYNEYVSH